MSPSSTKSRKRRWNLSKPAQLEFNESVSTPNTIIDGVDGDSQSDVDDAGEIDEGERIHKKFDYHEMNRI